MKYFVIILILIGFVGTSVLTEYVFAEEEIMIFVENDARKVYYIGENIQSSFYDHESGSVIFETGMNTKLEIKAPRVYKKGPEPFILKNGEEITGITKTDDCFYYIDIKTKLPEKIEIVFAFWPEYPETKDGCEMFVVSPLKQIKNGVEPWKVKCDEGLTLLLKPMAPKPVCVTGDTAKKLIERNWSLVVARGA